MSDQDIKITGEPQMDPQACKFTVDRPLFAGGQARFQNAEEAAGSPLAERLFGIEGIEYLQIGENAVFLKKNSEEMWPVMGKLIGTAIREHVQSGAEAVSEAIKANVADSDAIRGVGCPQ